MESLIDFIKNLPCISVRTSNRIVSMLELMDFTQSEKIDIDRGMTELEIDKDDALEDREEIGYRKGYSDAEDEYR